MLNYTKVEREDLVPISIAKWRGPLNGHKSQDIQESTEKVLKDEGYWNRSRE